VAATLLAMAGPAGAAAAEQQGAAGCVSVRCASPDPAPAPGDIEPAWSAWRDGDVARAESLATVLPPSDARSHVLFLTALVRGAYDDALAHHAGIGSAYGRLAELDGPVIDAYLHLGRPAAAHAFAAARAMEATTVAWLAQRAARPLAARLDTLSVVPFADHPLTPYFPAVAAELDGRPTIVHFDTGAPFLVMGPGRARALGIALVDAGTGLHGTRAVPMQRGLVGRFRLGDAVLENVPVAVLASLEGSQDFVIFGTNVLEQFHATLDYPNRRLILSPRADERWRRRHRDVLPGRHVAIPFFLWGDHYMFALGGFGARRDLNYFIDSGLVSLAPADGGLRQACFLATTAQYREWGVDSGVATQRHFASPLPVSLGPLEQRDQFFATVANPTWGSFGGVRIDGLLSHAFLKRYAWTIDFAARQYRFFEP
jgi:hypothetical protein